MVTQFLFYGRVNCCTYIHTYIHTYVHTSYMHIYILIRGPLFLVTTKLIRKVYMHSLYLHIHTCIHTYILGEKGEAIFKGRIRIPKIAQLTASEQLCRSLMLGMHLHPYIYIHTYIHTCISTYSTYILYNPTRNLYVLSTCPTLIEPVP